MDFDDISELVNGVKAIGDEINSWRSDAFFLQIREPKAFKTEADLRASALLNELIKRFKKNAVVISEEDAGFSDIRPDSYWLIDPIDGTASWYEGFPGFVTQICYIQKGIPEIGIIYAPALEKLWLGIVGKGAFLNGTRLEKRDGELFDSGFVLVDNFPEPKRISKIIYDNFNVIRYIESGSLGLKSLLVADGTSDLFVKDVVIRDWDVAAASVILNELGCYISDLEGNPINYYGSHEKNKGLLVAANAKLANTIIQFTREFKCV
ncbi:Inositol-1-monophosphatase [Nitrincola lacisaponensis]|uniref:Inositol-1-monophosphatase n=2 Tax=Nitrincola lacisaponensis TaxID=267850 RepID=A0A063Y9Z5_9GAMM|nr:Inositol-1-monophosphatase [Nitrincola lacisaponensis]